MMSYRDSGAPPRTPDDSELFASLLWTNGLPSSDLFAPIADPGVFLPVQRSPGQCSSLPSPMQATRKPLSKLNYPCLVTNTTPHQPALIGSLGWRTNQGLLDQQGIPHIGGFIPHDQPLLGPQVQARGLHLRYSDNAGNNGAVPRPNLGRLLFEQALGEPMEELGSTSQPSYASCLNSEALARGAVGDSLFAELLPHGPSRIPSTASSRHHSRIFEDLGATSAASAHMTDQPHAPFTYTAVDALEVDESTPWQTSFSHQPEFEYPHLSHHSGGQGRDCGHELDPFQTDNIAATRTVRPGLGCLDDGLELGRSPGMKMPFRGKSKDKHQQAVCAKRRLHYGGITDEAGRPPGVRQDTGSTATLSRNEYATVKDFEKHEDLLRKLYVDEGWSLQELTINLFLSKGFKATQKMYKRFFNKRGITKNKKRKEAEDHIGPGTFKRLRHRYMGAGEGDRLKVQVMDQIRGHRSIQRELLSAPTCRHVERILFDVSVLTHGCFDTLMFECDHEKWHLPQGMTDPEPSYKQLKAQLDRLIWSSQDKHPGPLMEVKVAFQTLNELVQPRFDTLVSSIRLLRSLKLLSDERKQPHSMRVVLGFMRGEALRRHGPLHPLPDLYEALLQMEPRAMYESLRVAHLRICFALESVLGQLHPSSIEYCSVHCDVWGSAGFSSKIAACQKLLYDLDRHEGKTSPQSMQLLDSIGRMAGKESVGRTEPLARDQIARCQQALALAPTDTYSEVRMYWKNAVVLLGNAFIESGQLGQFQRVYEELFDDLETGDVECARQASYYLAYVMAHLRKKLPDQVPRLEMRKMAVDTKVALMRAETDQPQLFIESEESTQLVGVLEGFGLTPSP